MKKLEINLKKDEFHDFFEFYGIECKARKFIKEHIKTHVLKTGEFIGPAEISKRFLSNNYKITITVEEL